MGVAEVVAFPEAPLVVVYGHLDPVAELRQL
jgi:hypothetical protein